MKRLPQQNNQLLLKKIGTGFRGNDAFELEGLLQACPEHLVFLVDHAPEIGTFTLYGHQYCEGEILPKSLYAKDPIFPPTESYIPDILGRDTKISIGTVDIDVIKGGNIAAAVQQQVEQGKRILVFDAITKADTQRILSALQPVYPNVFWTGSLGIADGLAEYLYGPAQKTKSPVRQIRCLGFCGSAYEIAQKQLAYSAQRGLCLIPVDIDAYIDGDDGIPERAAQEAIQKLKKQNVFLAPYVKKYSYQPGTSVKILECFSFLAQMICPQAGFDRLIIVGGETSQTIFRVLRVDHLELGRALEPAVAQGQIADGILAGKEFSLKGGSMGSESVLEKMMCSQEAEY